MARCVMDEWVEIIECKMRSCGLEPYMITKYVDDVVIVCKLMEIGMRYRSGKLVREGQDVLDDLRMIRRRREVTFMILKDMANDIFPYLQFTGEFSEWERTIPCLDTQVWIGQQSQEEPWRKGTHRTREVIPISQNTGGKTVIL